MGSMLLQRLTQPCVQRQGTSLTLAMPPRLTLCLLPLLFLWRHQDLGSIFRLHQHLVNNIKDNIVVFNKRLCNITNPRCRLTGALLSTDHVLRLHQHT